MWCGRFRLKPYSYLLIPACIYLAYTFVVFAMLKGNLNFFFLGDWHLLPLESLMQSPWRSLFLLHAQPPVMNFFLWLFHAQSPASGIWPELLSTIFFCLVGLTSCLAWYQCALWLLRSHLASTLIVLLIVLNPTLRQYDRVFHYTNLEMCQLDLFLLAAIAWSRRPTRARMLAAMLLLALLVYTRAIYHPVVGFLFAGLAFAHLWLKTKDWRAAARCIATGLAIYIAVLAPWMIKNRILFGFTGFSSWIGLNFIVDFANPDTKAAKHFVESGEFNQKIINDYYQPNLLKWYATEPALATLRKNTPSRDVNVNHYAIPPLSAWAMRHNLDVAKKRPDLICERLVRHFAAFDLPGYYSIYTRDHDKGTYKLMCDTPYARWFDKIYYGAFLRPRLDFIWMYNRVTPSLFIVLWWPLALLGTAWRARRFTSPDGFIHALMLGIYLWVFVLMMVIDGSESARMRWHLEAMYLIMLAGTLMIIAHGCSRACTAWANRSAKMKVFDCKCGTRFMWRKFPRIKHPRRFLCDILVLLLFVGYALWLTRPWILHPLTTTIGFYEADISMESVDTVEKTAFGGWIKFAVTELGCWPFSHTTMMRWPDGVAPGASFDSIMQALLIALLGCVVSLHMATSLSIIIPYALCGFTVYRFAKRLWGRGWLPLALGLTAQSMPFLWVRTGGHINLLYIWTIPVAMHLAHNFRQRPTWKRTLAFALAMPLLGASSWYNLIMGMIFLVAVALEFLIDFLRRRDPASRQALLRLLAAYAIGFGLVLLVASPMLLNYHPRYKLDDATLTHYSPPLLEYLMPSRVSLIERSSERVRAALKWIDTDLEAWCGGPILALLLMSFLLFRRQAWPLAFSYRLAFITALILSLGPYLQLTHATPAGVGLKLPLYYLIRLSDSFRLVKAPGRFHLMINFIAFVGAGYALYHLRQRYLTTPIRRRIIWPVLLLCFVAVNMAWSIDYARPQQAYTNLRVPEFYTQLDRQPGRGAVMDLPLHDQVFPHYNYYQFTHKRPAVTTSHFHDTIAPGSEKFFHRRPYLRFLYGHGDHPPTEAELARLCGSRFWRSLRKKNIEYVVVHPIFANYLSKKEFSRPWLPGVLARVEKSWASRKIYEDDLIRVYRTR